MTLSLHRSRRSLVLGVLVVVGGLAAAVCAAGAVNTLTTVFYGVFAGVALLLGAVLVRDELRPFRFEIGPDGLTLPDGLVPWAGIEAVELDEPVSGPGGPYLRLVPPDRVVLRLDDVRERTADVVAALTAHAGDRFTDAPAERRAILGATDFPVVLRGYDQAHVNALLRLAADALRPGGEADRRAAKDAVDATDIPRAGRGYAPDAVDRALRALSVRLR
ncbi:hypothetical protein ABZS66_24690 [Dactylosporangium sp. NPDC005572]|uniref:hypothetical protein n=1 Tax=Dactylosporangium sp. NPDC005572 TaxID=3156889 RepID=UPI0033A0211E